jgi:hypothetical protein
MQEAAMAKHFAVFDSDSRWGEKERRLPFPMFETVEPTAAGA